MEAHHHHPIHVQSAKMGKILGWSILLNLLFVLVEAGVGFSQGSLSLLSDAGHNLSDVFSLILVAVGFRLSKLHANARFTYGYRKSTILISLLNAIILLLAVGGIIIEAIHKFSHPMPVNGAAVGWTAFVGIIVNDLNVNLLVTSEHRHTRAFSSTGNLIAYSMFNLDTSFGLCYHTRTMFNYLALADLPDFLLISSPWKRIPLPL